MKLTFFNFRFEVVRKVERERGGGIEEGEKAISVAA